LPEQAPAALLPFESTDHLFEGMAKQAPEGRSFKIRKACLGFKVTHKCIFSITHGYYPG
jgi:hypothetical protein